MKNLGLLVLGCLTLLLNSCSKETDATVQNIYDPAASTYLKGKVANEDFATNTVSAQWVTHSQDPSLDYLIITAEVAGATQQGTLTLKLRNTLAGTYLTNLQQEISFKPTGSSVDKYMAVNAQNLAFNTGQVQLLTVDTQKMTLSGLYNFTAFWSGADSRVPLHFTSGIFQNVPIIKVPFQNDPFTATLNDGTFNGIFNEISPVTINFTPATSTVGNRDEVHFLAVSQDTQLIVAFYFDKTSALGAHAQPADNLVKARIESFPSPNSSIAPYDGDITLTAFDVDHRLQGTFNLKFHNPDATKPDIILTNGSFDLTF